jgi:hypothetical protein
LFAQAIMENVPWGKSHVSLLLHSNANSEQDQSAYTSCKSLHGPIAQWGNEVIRHCLTVVLSAEEFGFVFLLLCRVWAVSA